MKNKNVVNYFKEYFKDWNLFEKIWLLSFTLINIYLFFAWEDTLVGLITSLTGMLCVVLTAKARISNYYFGIVNVILYAYIALQSKFYGEVALNLLYFLPMSFVGIYYWYRHKNKKKLDTVYIMNLQKSQIFIWSTISILGVITYGLILKYFSGTLPFVDASSTVLSIIGMILTVKRATQQWLVWIVEDIIEVIMWVYIFVSTGGDISMVVMWSAYLVNAVYGYYNWKKIGVNQYARN